MKEIFEIRFSFRKFMNANYKFNNLNIDYCFKGTTVYFNKFIKNVEETIEDEFPSNLIGIANYNIISVSDDYIYVAIIELSY